MPEPLVSVVMPIYDRPLFLRTRAIPSLLRQTYPHWELIVVGDGPQDNSIRKVVEDFHDPRMRYVEIPRPDYSNLTPKELWHCAGAAARNYGLDLAKGDIFAPLDDDDEFLENHLADCVHAISIEGYDLVYGKTILRNIETGRDLEDYLPWEDPTNRALFEKQNIMYHSNVCYSGRFRHLRYPADGHIPDDYGLWLAIYKAGGRFVSLAEPHSIYYGDQLTSRIHVSIPPLPSMDNLQKSVASIFTSDKPSQNTLWHDRLEQTLADYFQTSTIIATTNGYSAFLMAFAALRQYDPGRHDVILPSNASPIVVHALIQNGLKPVFCDIDPYSLCITPQTLAPLMSKDTVAIMGVHVYGNPCDMPSLEQLVEGKDIVLLADASDALGATIQQRHISTFGAMAITDLGSSDILPDHEGAMICCQHPFLAQILRSLRSKEQINSFFDIFGPPSHMTPFSSALLLTQLPSLDNMLKKRQKASHSYKVSLQQIPAIKFQEIAVENAIRSNKKMCVLLDNPQLARYVVKRLMAYRIESCLLSKSLHRLPMFADYQHGSLLGTEQVADSLIGLPMYADIRDQVIDLVSDVCKEALG